MARVVGAGFGVAAGAGVGLGEWRVSTDAEEVLVAFGLGSCVAVILHDPCGLAGIVHVVLPDSRGDARGAPGKFADTAVPHLAAVACKAGASPSRLRAVICGGASMFSLANLPDVGRANVEAVRRRLAAEGIRLCAEDVGGNRGRTVRVEVGAGRVTVAGVGRDPTALWAR